MQLGVLTTDTAHHRYFLRRLVRDLPPAIHISLNVFETIEYPWKRLARQYAIRALPNIWRGLGLNPYIQSGSLTRAQSEFDETQFFPDGDRSIPDGFRSVYARSANDEEVGEFISDAGVDLLVVYGTGKLRPHVFEGVDMGAINAHGGLLPGYRGLDTNLWAALEGAPEDMAVTVHGVDQELDTGPVYGVRRLGRIPGLDLRSLRYHTAILATDLLLEVIVGIYSGQVRPERQREAGRYFGHMPILLKRRAERIIKSYSASEVN